MSKTPVPARDPIASFMEKALAASGFEDITKRATVRRWTVQCYGGDYIGIHVARSFELPCKPFPLPKRLVVDILLRPSQRHGCFLVERFSVEGTSFMHGVSLLEHYAKRFALFKDYHAASVADCWQVRCAADVEALLKAYDRVALNTGRPTVFNLK